MSIPGSTVTLTQIVDYPGLHEQWSADRPYFERAYEVAEEADAVLRLRFRPVAIDSGMEANIALMPRNLSIFASASLVDGDGQVIQIAGRGLVRPARSFSQEVSSSEPFDQEAFILLAAKIQAEDLIQFKRQIGSASLLIPPPEAS